MSEQPSRRQREVLDKQRLRTFLLGGAAGILAGILLAPRSGRELRGSIRERAGEARERGRESLFEAQERMQERISEAREGSVRPPDPEPAPDLARSEPTSAPSRPFLRDVSSGADEPPARGVGGPEELRRKVRETRTRLRENREGPRGGGDLSPGP